MTTMTLTRERTVAPSGERTWAMSLTLAAATAIATGLSAQARFYLPGNLVPITLQTFVVLLGGMMLGRKWGVAGQGLYVGAGALGLPWFAAGGFGLAALAGPTGGYLLGFLPAAMIAGWAGERFRKDGRVFPLVATLTGAVALIYALGTAHFTILTHDIVKALTLCVVPFIAIDAAKVCLAVAIARRVLRPQD